MQSENPIPGKLKSASNSKCKELCHYLLFGSLTTLVNVASYYLLTEKLGVFYLTGNAFAWLLAVSFAFVTNKRFVFRPGEESRRDVKEACLLFFCSRFFSGMLDMGLMFVFVTIAQADAFISKILVVVGVILFNFTISKHLIFI